MTQGEVLLLSIARLSSMIAQLGPWHRKVPGYRAERERLREQMAKLPDIDLKG